MTIPIQTLIQSTHEIKQIFEGDAAVKRWRLYATRSKSDTAGFSKKSVADIYQPASQQSSTYLQFAVELDDQRIAYGQVNPTQQTGADILKLVHATAIVSKESLTLAPPSKQSDLPLLVAPDGYPDAYLTELLPHATQLRDTILATDPQAFEGELSGSYNQAVYLDSNGLELHSQTTRFEGELELDGKLATDAEARTPELVVPTLLKRIETLSSYSKQLEGTPLKPAHKRIPVFIVSGGDLIDSFLIENLGGMRILDGNSPFQLKDFKQHTQIAHKNFTLSFDQRRALDTKSFGFTSEGVTGQRFTLIQDGKLTEPLCGLKASERLGYPPRVAGHCSEAVLDNLVDFETARKEVGTFVLTFHAMGIHTQNTTLGTYSLPAPDSLYFENGELVGPVKPVLTGNFFDVMKSDSMRFVHSDLFDDPLLQFETDITF